MSTDDTQPREALDIVAIAREVLKRDKEATPGPWGQRWMTDQMPPCEDYPTALVTFPRLDDGVTMRAPTTGDASLIVHARTSAPNLAAFVVHFADVVNHAPVRPSDDRFDQGWNAAVEYVRALGGLPESPLATTPPAEAGVLTVGQAPITDHGFWPGDADRGWDRQCSQTVTYNGERCHCGYPPEAHERMATERPLTDLEISREMREAGEWRKA